MNKTVLASALALSLGLGGAAAFAQTPPVGGPDAKGNAPLKHMHTVNDGSAKPGANSFTEGQARQHIVNSGYSGVTGLTKGQDGVWRGMASRNGAQVNVAMDFKGNVTEAAPAGAAMTGSATNGSGMGGSDKSTSTTRSSAASSTGGGMAAGSAAAGGMAAGAMVMHHHHHHHHHVMHRHHGGHCANPGPNGAACSGVDSTGSGVSDREKRAMDAGAHP